MFMLCTYFLNKLLWCKYDKGEGFIILFPKLKNILGFKKRGFVEKMSPALA